MTTEPISLALSLGLLALVPLLVVMTTSFIKIAVVILLLRNALGIQQIPPNMVVYCLALVLSLYVMAPVLHSSYQALQQQADIAGLPQFFAALQAGAEPLRDFMLANADPAQRGFFLRTAEKLWPAELSAQLTSTNFAVLTPAFLVSELTSAFQIGFLLCLPFLVIDLVISNILLAMGMMMVSPATVALPLKLLLFVAVDGWTRLIQGMVLSYV